MPSQERLSEKKFVFPASAAQKGFWFLDQLRPGNPACNVAVRFRLSGKLNRERLEASFNLIVQRHEALRTRFVLDDRAEAVQVVEPRLLLSLTVTDLRHLHPDQRSREAEQLCAEEATKPFELQKLPLIRTRLLQLAEEEHLLLVTVHHAVADGWSIGIMTDELAAIYAAYSENRPPELPDLRLQYADYALWEQDCLSNGAFEPQAEFWKRKLSNVARLELPTDLPRPASKSFKGEITSILLPRSLTDSALDAAAQRGCTLFHALLAAFLAVLHKWSNQSDIVIGTLVAGRNSPDLEPVIGTFVNSIALPFHIPEATTLSGLMSYTCTVVLAALANQDIPFESVVEAVKPPRDARYHPFFHVNTIYQRDFVKPVLFSGLELTPIPSKAAGSIYDLNFFLVERADGWRASIEFNTELYRSFTIAKLLKHFEAALRQMTDAPDTPLAALKLATAEGETGQKKTAELRSGQALDHYVFDNYVPPRNQTEAGIIEIWQRILKISRVGAYSNFFDLGGHSLNAAAMISAVKQRFGGEVTLSGFFVEPTIAALSRIVSGEASYSDPREIVPIQPHGNRPPFFLIGGDHWFRPLAGYVGLDQPFLGVPLLKYRHLNFAESRRMVAEELGDLILSQFPHGPFLVGGWCADGLTAIEVARSIQKHGHSIGLVVLFDTVNPDYYREARALVHSFGRTLKTLQRIAQAAIARGPWKSFGFVASSLRSVAGRIGTRVTETYSATYFCEPCSFPVLILRPPSGALEQPDLGWRRACLDKLTVEQVPGDHSSIFREPNVPELGRKLRAQIDIALAELGFDESPDDSVEQVVFGSHSFAR